ncbi:response regulator [Jutongia sp.]
MALIYIVEDDKNISEIESFSLKNAGHQTVEFPDGRSFYKELAEKKPDLILLDIMLPDEDGLSILRKIREKRETKRIPVIMVTAKTTEIDKVKGLDNGADDYMTKPFGVMELVSRVKALLRRTGEQDAEKVIKIGDLVIDDEKRKVFVSGSAVELTYKEYELLHYLAQNQEIVLPRDSIMDHIWHANCEIESRTLDVHIKTLRHKLGDAGKYIKTVRNVGYCMNLV